MSVGTANRHRKNTSRLGARLCDNCPCPPVCQARGRSGLCSTTLLVAIAAPATGYRPLLAFSRSSDIHLGFAASPRSPSSCPTVLEKYNPGLPSPDARGPHHSGRATLLPIKDSDAWLDLGRTPTLLSRCAVSLLCPCPPPYLTQCSFSGSLGSGTTERLSINSERHSRLSQVTCEHRSQRQRTTRAVPCS